MFFMFLKGTVTDLEQRCTDLQGENREIQKQLRDCHVLLVAESLDPGYNLFELCWIDTWRCCCSLNHLKFSFRGKVGPDSSTEGRTKEKSYGNFFFFCICILSYAVFILFVYIISDFLIKIHFICLSTHTHIPVYIFWRLWMQKACIILVTKQVKEKK